MYKLTIKRTQMLIVTKPPQIFDWEKSYLWLLNTMMMKEISVQELKEKLDKGEDFQLVDVREDFEYET